MRTQIADGDSLAITFADRSRPGSHFTSPRSPLRLAAQMPGQGISRSMRICSSGSKSIFDGLLVIQEKREISATLAVGGMRRGNHAGRDDALGAVAIINGEGGGHIGSDVFRGLMGGFGLVRCIRIVEQH